jgi:Regulator of chromosome condensation (RCC1) repeat
VYDREQHDAQWLPPPQSKDRVYLLMSLADAALAAKEGAVPKDVKCEFCCSADTAVVEGNSDPGDLSDASLLLSTQWSDTDRALLRARAMQRLASELSHLCREGDAFTHAVAQCTHTLHSIHAAMTRAAAASKRSSTAAAVLRQIAASREQSTAAEASTPAGAVIGARLLMTLLDLAEASSCTGLKQSEFVSEIAAVLQSLLPLSLAVQQRTHAAAQTGQLSAAIVHRLRAFLYTASALTPPRRPLRQQQQQHLQSAQWQEYQAMKLDSLAALTSLACARGRASDLLLLVKALLCIDEQQQQLRRSSAEHPVNSATAAAVAVKRRERSPSLTVRSKAGSKPVRLRASLSLPLEAAEYTSEQPEQSTAECTVSVVRVWDSEKALPTTAAAAAAVVTAVAVAAPQKAALSSSDKKDKWKKRERAAALSAAAAASDPTAGCVGTAVAAAVDVGRARQHSSQSSSSSGSSSSKHAAQAHASPRVQPLPPQPAPYNGAALLLQLQAVSTEHSEGVALSAVAAATAAAAAAAVRRSARRVPTEVWTCGQNSYGELGFGDAGSRTEPGLVRALCGKDVVDVAAGNEHTVVVLRSGVLLTAGYNDNGQCATGSTQRVGSLTPVAALSGAHCTQAHSYNGCEHTLVVLKDGGLVAFGYNYRSVCVHTTAM